MTTRTPHKPLSKFEQGYVCAISNLISGHGCNTDAFDTFRALGVSLERIFADKNTSNFDKENLEHLKSFGAE
jgi:hypothetical protein